MTQQQPQQPQQMQQPAPVQPQPAPMQQPQQMQQPAPVQPQGLQPENNQTILYSDSTATPAAGSSAEDTGAVAYEQQIQRLIAQNEQLQNQIGLLLRNGAAVNDGSQSQPQQQMQPVQYFGQMTQQQAQQMASDEYVSLADLGREIGKRDYENINIEK